MLSFLKESIGRQPEKMISYAKFIEFSLYHPENGYYMKAGEKLGKKGDFITTSNISDIYGRLVAKWFLQKKEELELQAYVCEIGAGNGRFAAAFIDEWRKNSKEPLKYTIVESSPYHRELQRERVPFDEGIQQVESLDEVDPFEGFVFSNELFDALPVHVIEKKNGEFMEVMVSIEGERLAEVPVPLANERIQQFLEESNIELKDGQRIEIPLEMEGMVKKISEVLVRGMVITVDYGYSDEEWMEPIHRDGSLRGYYKHQQVNDVLLHPGEMDLTSHVHFDSFVRIGEKYGLQFEQKQRQDEFLMSIGILKELEDHYDPDPFSEISRRNRAIKSLIIPSGLSTFFHAITQVKRI